MEDNVMLVRFQLILWSGDEGTRYTLKKGLIGLSDGEREEELSKLMYLIGEGASLQAEMLRAEKTKVPQQRHERDEIESNVRTQNPSLLLIPMGFRNQQCFPEQRSGLSCTRKEAKVCLRHGSSPITR
jgi:hypothetical protein